MVSSGQTDTHIKHPTQVFLLMRTTPFLARVIAWTGQTSIQSPHWVQVIMWWRSVSFSATIIRRQAFKGFSSLKYNLAHVSSQVWHPTQFSSIFANIRNGKATNLLKWVEISVITSKSLLFEELILSSLETLIWGTKRPQNYVPSHALWNMGFTKLFPSDCNFLIKFVKDLVFL